MSFWHYLKRWLAAARAVSTGTPPEGVLEAVIDATVRSWIQSQRSFSDREIADQVLANVTPTNLMLAVGVVAKRFDDATLAALGYQRTERPAFGGRFVYHPVGSPIPAVVPPRTTAAPARGWGSSGGSSSTSSGGGGGSWTAQPSAPNPYEASEILGLSAEELRRRALRITPWRTAWIGRVDTIPPQSDERTALIDRGLVLRGLLSEAQLEEIHRVGDLWLRHNEAEKLVSAMAHASADQAIEQERARKAELKAARKAEAAARRERRAQEVAKRRAEDIVFLGEGVSGQLADRRSQIERLEAQGLPLLSTPADVAQALGIPVPRLRWLAFHAEAATLVHYVSFEVPKRSGGMRTLNAPHRELGAAQRWVFDHILSKLTFEDTAHGFVRGRSTVTCATPHVGRDVVLNLDLQDFFPTITFPRVRGLFHQLGYSPAVATVLALLCTEAPRRPIEYEGQRYFVAVGPRALPQGACTSPALSNMVVRRLDRRLCGAAAAAGWTYTRYADDLTFSAPPGHRHEIPRLQARIRHLVEEEGFVVHPHKGRVQRCGGQQAVTGVVVNAKTSLPRAEVRRLRAILHGARTTGLAAQNREGHEHFEAWLRGKLAYLAMVDRPKGMAMLAELEALVGG
jgi:retron-type reverse transcriptase